jgi:hypothetical protein
MEDVTIEQKVIIDAVKEKVAEATNEALVEDAVKNNTASFDFEGVTYRATKPNYKQKQDVYKERVKKFTELLKDTAYSLERDLKKIYLARGIDLDGMITKVTALEKEKQNLQYKLGEALKNSAGDNDCIILKKEIERVTAEQQVVAIERNSYLEFSVENQVLIHMYSYMTYLVSEKKEGDTWVRAFNTFEEFLAGNESLINQLAFLTTALAANEFNL